MPRRRDPKGWELSCRALLGVLIGAFLGMVLACGGFLRWTIRHPPAPHGDPVVAMLALASPFVGGLLGAVVGGLIGWFGLSSMDRAGNTRRHWLEGFLGMGVALAGTILFGPAIPAPPGVVVMQVVIVVIGGILGLSAGAIIAIWTRAPLIDFIFPRRNE